MKIALLGYGRSGTTAAYRVMYGVLKRRGYIILYEPFAPGTWKGDLRRIRHYWTGIQPTDHYLLPEPLQRLFKLVLLDRRLYEQEKYIRLLIKALAKLDNIALKEVFTLKFAEDYIKAGFKLIILIRLPIEDVKKDWLHMKRLSLSPNYIKFKILNRYSGNIFSGMIKQAREYICIRFVKYFAKGSYLPPWARIDVEQWLEIVSQLIKKYPDKVTVFIYHKWLDLKSFYNFLENLVNSPYFSR